ncbi:MAG: hypothetical protein ACI4DS_06275 [Eubacterium sp.]
MRKYIKRFFGLAIFICIALFLYNKVSGVLKMDISVVNVPNYNTFYELDENTVDGIILGNSVIDRGYNPVYAWNQTGMATYSLSSESQPLAMTTSLMEEALKTQNPKFFVVELHSLRSSKFYSATEVFIRRAADAMKPSLTRMKAVKAGIDYYNNVSEYRVSVGRKELDELDNLSLYFPFIKYHTRWEEVTRDDYEVLYSDVMSAYTETKTFHQRAVGPTEVTDEAGGLTDYQKEVLMQVIDYCDENKINVVFVSIPSVLTVTEQTELNEAFEIIEAYDSPYVSGISFNTNEMYKELGIDWDKDFYNNDHLNSKGGIKFTTYMAEYLKNKFNIEDKRDDESYDEWDKAYETYMDFFNKGWENENE